MNFIRHKICSNVLIIFLLTTFMSIIFSEPVCALQMQSNFKIEINSVNKNMIVGDRQALNTVIVSDDKIIGKANTNVTYESSNINVVKIENNELSAIGKGIACITATYENKKAITVIYVDEKKEPKKDLEQKNFEVKLQWSRKQTELVLDWSKVEELSKFKVLKKFSNESEYKEIEKEGKGNKFIDEDILPNCEYSYRIILNDKNNNSFKLNDFTVPKYIIENKQKRIINDKKVNTQDLLKHINEKIKVKKAIIQDNTNGIKNNKNVVLKETFSNNKSKLLLEKNSEKKEEKEDSIIEEKYDTFYGVEEPIILEKGLLKEINGKVTLKYYYSNKAKIDESNLALYSIDNTGLMTEVKDALLDNNKKTISFALNKDGIYCIKEKTSLKEEKVIEKSNNLKQDSKNELPKKSLEKYLKNNEEEHKNAEFKKEEKDSKENLEKDVKSVDLKANINNPKEKKEIKIDNNKVENNTEKTKKEDNITNSKEVKIENKPNKDNIENSKKSNLHKKEDIEKEKTKERIDKKEDKNSISIKNDLKDNEKSIKNDENLNDDKSFNKDSKINILNKNVNKEIKNINEELLIKKESTVVKRRRKRSIDFNLSEIEAYMATATNVYSGPNTYYSVIGSVDYGEEVRAIASEWGWIYIEYRTGSGLKRGYVTASQLMNSESVDHSVNEDYFTGYAGAVRQDTAVLSGPGNNYRQAGSIYSGEGITVFSNGRSLNNGYAYIEFSTPSSTKRGYIETSLLTSKRRGILASVEKDTRTLAAPKVNAAKLGSVDFHELVVVLNRLNKSNDSWNYLEYNTKLGRKRGYAYANNFKNRVDSSPDDFDDSEVKIGQSTKDMTVYSGPNSNYAKMGSVNLNEKVRLFKNYSGEQGYNYIEYGTKTGLKRGYVSSNYIRSINPKVLAPIQINKDKTYKDKYGETASQTPLNYYKIGSGNKKALIAVFAIHGFEDAWANDGEELYKIAQNLITDLEGLENLSGWEAYIIPTANPDGLIEGFTNDGPGRCNIEDEMDLNRSFPTGYVSFEGKGSRNNNGSTSLIPREAKKLRDFIYGIKQKHDSTVLLDVHGWENNTIGNNEIGAYFGEQFKFGHNPSSGGEGYLISWGNENHIKSVLVELPWPNSPQDIVDRDFAGKVSRAIQNIFKENPCKNDEKNAYENNKEQDKTFEKAKIGKLKDVTSKLRIRSSAELRKNNENVIGYLNPDATVEIIGEKGDWYKINAGYVSKDYIQIINSAPINNTNNKPKETTANQNQNSNEKPIEEKNTITKIIDYVKKSLKQVIKGTETDEVTLLGTGADLALAFTGAGILQSVRDIKNDLKDFDGSLSNWGTLALDAAGILPVAGVFKCGKKIKVLLQNEKGVLGLVDTFKVNNKTFKASDLMKKCFTEDTLIHTENGLKAIKDIKIGDKVYSENTYTKEITLKKVESTFIKDSNKLIYIHLKNDIIKTTENHPFYVENKGWISAGTLTENDKLRCSDGTILNINKIEKKLLKNSIKVYNFEVEDWHNYFVGKSRVLVHNSCFEPTKGVTQAERLIPGTPGVVTGGSSTKLGKNIMESMGLKRSTKWTGHQAQHIIPAEMADNPILQKIGMNLDYKTNGILLRTPDAELSAMSRHRGYHSVYNDVVRNQLNKMNVNQSVDVLQRQVFDLQSDLRKLQESGLPLYPSQGATVDLWERSLSRIRKQ